MAGSMEEALGALEPRRRFEVPDLLFRKISDEERDAWEEQFAGFRG